MNISPFTLLLFVVRRQRIVQSGGSTRLFGIKATIRIVGRKTSEKWIEDGCKMYETRLKPNNVDVQTEWCKTNDALIKNVKSDVSGAVQASLA
mmetsp:Transcript_37736/g.78337  ORF Transcript_37736/g.78337 Transcript_37736/m.78337 type:complete len:93 (+) Transcript_37736:55-333(+)